MSVTILCSMSFSGIGWLHCVFGNHPRLTKTLNPLNSFVSTQLLHSAFRDIPKKSSIFNRYKLHRFIPPYQVFNLILRILYTVIRILSTKVTNYEKICIMPFFRLVGSDMLFEALLIAFIPKHSVSDLSVQSRKSPLLSKLAVQMRKAGFSPGR